MLNHLNFLFISFLNFHFLPSINDYVLIFILLKLNLKNNNSIPLNSNSGLKNLVFGISFSIFKLEGVKSVYKS